MPHSHRATIKKNHKSFKSKHATKSALKTRNKGKVEKDLKGSSLKHVTSKQDRKNTARQLKAHKLMQLTENKKLFEGRHGAPRIVAMIPLSADCDPREIVRHLLSQCCDNSSYEIPDAGSVNVSVDRFKQKLQFIIPKRSFLDIIDVAKVADFVVFVLSSTVEVDSFGELCIKAIELQGVSNVVTVVNRLGSVGNSKAQSDVRDSLFSYFNYYFPSLEKIYAPEISSEALNVVRYLCQKFPSGVHWRDSRSYMLADSVDYDHNQEALVVEGVLRGRDMNADRLIHIPGYGDYQISKIEKSVVHPPSFANKRDGDLDMEDGQILATPTENQDTLDELASLESIDDESMEMDIENGGEIPRGVRLDGHYYFDDDNGLSDYNSEAEDNVRTRRAKKNRPQGMSEYQATWIVDDDDDDDDNDAHEEDSLSRNSDDMLEDNGEETGFGESVPAPSEYAHTEPGDLQSEMFIDLSQEEEEKQLKEFRARAKEDLDFPDEIEIHPDVSAKERLHRYRGLKNLRTCTWDANEKDPRAPDEFKRLMQINNFKATTNRINKESILNANVPAGTRIRLYIMAPEYIASSHCADSPFIVFSLLQHEHKQGVVNLSITPNTEYSDSTASKEPLIMQCGPRRLVIRPLYSQAGSNAPNNVYKYERYLHPGRTSTATIQGPVTFGANVPVLYFKQIQDRLELVGSGSVMDADHNRILAKRVILTGHPLKIHKRLVTIRYMFFNAEDVLWFKAVPLFTKMGRSGYIKESLGTHGYFKATFDGKLNSQDTVGMALYKRVWPRPTTVWNGTL